MLLNVTQVIDDIKMFPWFANYPRTTWTIYHMMEDVKYGEAEVTEWPGETGETEEVETAHCLAS